MATLLHLRHLFPRRRLKVIFIQQSFTVFWIQRIPPLPLNSRRIRPSHRQRSSSCAYASPRFTCRCRDRRRKRQRCRQLPSPSCPSPSLSGAQMVSRTNILAPAMKFPISMAAEALGETLKLDAVTEQVRRSPRHTLKLWKDPMGWQGMIPLSPM